jgi:phosphatidylserine/phosphatidylglycerophosphate/cardiolipin synthase-like enzyme
MHDKFIVIDGETVELGSFNYTAAAEKRNAENVLVLHDPGGGAPVRAGVGAALERIAGDEGGILITDNR